MIRDATSIVHNNYVVHFRKAVDATSIAQQ